MRFGIKANQINSFFPSNLPLDNLVTYLKDLDHSNIIRGLASYGFNPIELGGDLALFLPHTFKEVAVERLSNLKKELNIGYTLHLPVWSVELSTPLDPVRQGSVKTTIEAIKSAQVLEPEVYVFHATGALAAEFSRMRIPEPARTMVLSQFLSRARESIVQILAKTDISSRMLAIETVEFPLELTLSLAEEFNLSICFDTGHVLAGFSGPVNFFDVLERCLPRLTEIHLHDGACQDPENQNGYGRDRLRLGAGDLDIPRFLDRLQAAHYNGPIIFELMVEEANPSRELLRSLRPEIVPG